jgi:hypothetical protein
MENEEIMVKPLRLEEPRRLETGLSNINLNPIDVVEKLGKYEFIYDYQVPNFSLLNYLQPLQSIGFTLPSTIKEVASNANMIAPTSIWSGQSFPQPVKFNSEPQVGTFSKGNIVNVVRFEGNNAIIENPNYVEPDPNAPKGSFFSSLGDLKKQKEFTIPKSYLRKVDDSLAVTVSTGILYGANMLQPVYVSNPVKPVYDTTLEQNATFVLTKDFDYVSGSKMINDGIKSGSIPVFSTLKAGTKVSGRLFSKYIKGFSGGIASAYRPDTQQNVLEVKNYGIQGSIEIPIEYLTRPIVSVVSLVDKKTGKCNQTGLIQTMEYNPCRVSAIMGETYKGYISGGSFYTTDGKTFIPINEYKIIEENNGSGIPTNSSTFIPENIDNKNLLMIAGAFLVGYVLFNKGKSE